MLVLPGLPSDVGGGPEVKECEQLAEANKWRQRLHDEAHRLQDEVAALTEQMAQLRSALRELADAVDAYGEQHTYATYGALAEAHRKACAALGKETS